MGRVYPGQTRQDAKGVPDALFSCVERDTNVNTTTRVEIEKNVGSGGYIGNAESENNRTFIEFHGRIPKPCFVQ